MSEPTLPAGILSDIRETMQTYQELGEQAKILIASVQALVDRLAAMDELRVYIQPQGPIEITVPLKSALPR